MSNIGLPSEDNEVIIPDSGPSGPLHKEKQDQSDEEKQERWEEEMEKINTEEEIEEELTGSAKGESIIEESSSKLESSLGELEEGVSEEVEYFYLSETQERGLERMQDYETMMGSLDVIFDELKEELDVDISKERQQFLVMAFMPLYESKLSEDQMKGFVKDYFEYLQQDPDAKEVIEYYYRENQGAYIDFYRNANELVHEMRTGLAKKILPESWAKTYEDLSAWSVDWWVEGGEKLFGIDLKNNPEMDLIAKYNLETGKKLKDKTNAFFEQYASSFQNSLSTFYKESKPSRLGYENRAEQKRDMFELPSNLPKEKTALSIQELQALMFDRWFKQKRFELGPITEDQKGFWEKIGEVVYGSKERTAEDALNKMREIVVDLYVYNGFTQEQATEMFDRMQKDLLDHYRPDSPKAIPEERLEKEYVDFLENNKKGYKSMKRMDLGDMEPPPFIMQD